MKKYRDRIQADDYGWMFPFKSYNKFFVALVNFYSGGALGVGAIGFEEEDRWDAESRRRVIVPQLVA